MSWEEVKHAIEIDFDILDSEPLETHFGANQRSLMRLKHSMVAFVARRK